MRNIVGGYRCSVLLKYNNLEYPLSSLTKYYFIGNFFNLFLPAVIGRDIARGYYLYTSSSGKKETISVIVVESFIGIAALMLLSLFSVLLAVFLGFDTFESDIIRIIVIAFGLCCILIVLFFNKKTDLFLKHLASLIPSSKFEPVIIFFREMIKYNKKPLTLWYVLLISVIFQLIGVISTFLIALSLGNTTEFIYFLIFLPVIWVVSMVPVSINGLGVREVTFVFLFGTTGMTEEMAMAICILWLVQTFGLGLIGSVLFILEGQSLSKIKQYRNVSMDQSQRNKVSET